MNLLIILFIAFTTVIKAVPVPGLKLTIEELNEETSTYTVVGEIRAAVPRLSVIGNDDSTYCNKDQLWFQYDVLNKLDTVFRLTWTGVDVLDTNRIAWEFRTNGLGSFSPRVCSTRLIYGSSVNASHDCTSANYYQTIHNVDMDQTSEITFVYEFSTPTDPSFEFFTTHILEVRRNWRYLHPVDYSFFLTDDSVPAPFFPSADISMFHNNSRRNMNYFHQFFDDGETAFRDFVCEWFGIVCGFDGPTPFIKGICTEDSYEGVLEIDFEELNTLEFLYLDRGRVSVFNCSSSNTNIASITKISLYNNQLNTFDLDMYFDCFPNLVELILGSQPITLASTVDISGISSPTLEVLNLDNLKIGDIIGISTSFPNLKNLVLSRNSIKETSLPGILTLSHLTSLDLSNNNFGRVLVTPTDESSLYYMNPDYFDNLKILILTNSNFDGNLPCFPNASFININQNYFVLEENDFLGCLMNDLTALYMERSRFSSRRIPDFASSMPNLEILDLDSTDVSLGQAVANPFPQSLVNMELRQSNLVIDNALWGLTNLRRLLISNNVIPSFAALSSSSTAFNYFECMSCGISEVWPSDFSSKWVYIEELQLSNNNFRDLELDEPFPSLLRLRMENSQLNRVGNLTGMLPDLILLDLSGNRITEIAGLAESITWLDLQNNLLTSEDWSPTFWDLQSLQSVYLDNNRLFGNVATLSPASNSLQNVFMRSCALYGVVSDAFWESVGHNSARIYFDNNMIFNDVGRVDFNETSNTPSFITSMFEDTDVFCKVHSGRDYFINNNAFQGYGKQDDIKNDCGGSSVSIPDLFRSGNPFWCHDNETTSAEYDCIQFKVLGPFFPIVSRYNVDPIITVTGNQNIIGKKVCPFIHTLRLANSYEIPCFVIQSSSFPVKLLETVEATTLEKVIGTDGVIVLQMEFDVGSDGSIKTFDVVLQITVVDNCPEGLFLVDTPALKFCGCDFGSSGSNGVIDQCRECPPGRFTEEQGLLECDQCPYKTYSDQAGSSSCTDCPVNTETIIGQPARNITDCNCIKGFYGADPRACKVCPVGGVCPGATDVPHIASGYWRYPDRPDIFYACNPKEACQATDTLESKCKEGYTGDLCGICMPKEYYKLGGYCNKCPNTSGFILASLFILLFIGVCVLLYHSQPRLTKLHSLGIILTWLQLIALFGSIPAFWPSGVETTYNILSFSNLNIELFSPECSVSMSYWTKLYLKLLSPVFFIGILFFLYSIQVLFGSRFPWIQAFFNTPISESLMFRCWERDYGRHRKDMYLKSRYVYALSVLTIALYTLLASTSSEPFNCTEQSSGVFTMSRNPSQECFNDDWYFHIQFILFFNAFYIIGIPLFAYILLTWNRKVIFEPHFLNAFGSFVLPYRQELFKWEVMNLSRRALMIFIIDFGHFLGSEFIQLFLMISLLFGYLVIQVFWSPYRTKSNNKLTFVWLTTSIFCLFSGVIFRSKDSVPTAENEAFGWLFAVMFVFATCYSLRAVFNEFNDNLFVSRTEDRDNMHMLFLRDERFAILKAMFPVSHKLIWEQMGYQGPLAQEKFFKELDAMIRHHELKAIPDHEKAIKWTPNDLYIDGDPLSIISRTANTPRSKDAFLQQMNTTLDQDHILMYMQEFDLKNPKTYSQRMKTETMELKEEEEKEVDEWKEDSDLKDGEAKDIIKSVFPIEPLDDIDPRDSVESEERSGEGEGSV